MVSGAGDDTNSGFATLINGICSPPMVTALMVSLAKPNFLLPSYFLHSYARWPQQIY
jgi:hypothetical protein